MTLHGLDVLGALFSSDKPLRPSDVDVSSFRGPGGRELSPEEMRFARSFAAFGDLVKKWKDANPTRVHWIKWFEDYRDGLQGSADPSTWGVKVSYLEAVQYNEPARGKAIKVIADAMERLYAEMRKITTDVDGNVRDLNKEIKDAASLAAWEEVFNGARRALGAVVDPARRVVEGAGDLAKATPWIIGGAVALAAAILGVLAWRLGPTAGKVAEDVVRKRLGA